MEEDEDTELLSLPDIAQYKIISKVGEGAYGQVYKAVHKESQEIVAMKRITRKKNIPGLSSRHLREMKLLKSLHHENIINLIEVCCTRGRATNDYKITFTLILDYCDHDLSSLLFDHCFKIGLGDIKNILKQLLQGVSFIHSKNILHRDIKTANILVTKTGVLKVADFGLSKKIHPDKNESHTNKVVTLWYRSPELLLGDRLYGPSVDMWSVGCVMGELFKRSPMIRGETEQKQLILISNLINPISQKIWPSVASLELFGKIKLPKRSERRLQSKYKPLIKDATTFDLLEKLLTLDPTKRISAEASLKHDIFVKDPLPAADLTKVMTHLQNMYEALDSSSTASERDDGGNASLYPEVIIVEQGPVVIPSSFGVEESEVSILSFNLPTGTEEAPPVTIAAPLSSVAESIRPRAASGIVTPEVEYNLAPASSLSPESTGSSSERTQSVLSQERTITITDESDNEDNDQNVAE